MTATAITTLNSGFDVLLDGGDKAPLSIEVARNVDTSKCYSNCAAAKRAGFPVLISSGGKTTEQPCLIVGTGFSVNEMLPEIKRHYEAGIEIIAVKGAHDWLIERGIIPRAAVAMDGQASRAKCFRNRRSDVLYLCASQMHPSTWKYMRGYRVLIWHSQIGVEQRTRPEWTDAFLIPSASDTGSSTILLMAALGRRIIHTFGIDACMPQPVGFMETVRPITKVDGSRGNFGHDVYRIAYQYHQYFVTPEMAAQATGAKAVCTILAQQQATLYAHGSSLFKECVDSFYETMTQQQAQANDKAQAAG